MRTQSIGVELELGSVEPVLDSAVIQQASQQRTIPNRFEILEHIDVTHIEEIDEADGLHL